MGGRSRFNYGLPPYAYPLINLPVGGVPIQHDLISYFAGILSTKIRYLEIGVSVGKGLLTQLNFLGPKAEVGSRYMGTDRQQPTFFLRLLHWT